MWKVEHTDTFGGEANYCWAHRYEIPDASRLALIRRAKALCGLTGVRCDVTSFGDMYEIRPRGLCQVLFVSWLDQ